MRRALPCLLIAAAVLPLSARPSDPPLEREAQRFVERTLARMTLDEQIGQMLVPSFESRYLSTDSDTFERLARLTKELHVGGFLVFGASEPVPGVLLNPTYGTVTLGNPHSAAATLNALQRIAAVPLLNAADFEFGVGMRIAGGTQFPRAMAFGAAGDPALAESAGRIIGEEARALGIHVNFAPVADVNNNPRNPVINTRSFGEDPAKVGELAAAFARGLQAGGVIATLKHFPGHGDTDVDTHLGLATVPHARERLDAVELAPFRLALAGGAGAVMVAHVEMSAIDPTRGTPATLSKPVVDGLLRRDLGFGGLVYTDSMSMAAIGEMASPGEAAVRAVVAGNDFVLHSPDDAAAHAAIRAAVDRGEISAARIAASVKRILTAKARLGLHRERRVDLDALATSVGGRAHAAMAREVSERSLTLVRDEHDRVPLSLPKEANVLVLSVLDYPGGWRIASPGRTFIPEVRRRWPNVTAVELSDRSTRNEIDLVRAMAPRFDAIVAAVFVRAASGSGRLDLSPPLVSLLEALGRGAGERQPFVAAFFGNPYVTAGLKELPAMLLTYDFGDLAEESAVRAIAGEIPIRGRLPVAIPGLAEVGFGLTRGN